MTKYAELRLRIDRGVGRGSYRIVATGPAGEALGRFKLPFSELELENFILKVGATRRGRRRIDSPEMDLAKTFGTKLFGALFEGDVRELYRSSFSETRAAGQGLRVTLSLTGAPELLQVPWEYMYDHPSFLSISTWTPIVRYLDLPKPRRPLQVALPIRILAMVSSPNDAEAIDAQQERAKLEAALGPLIESGAIAIDWLQEASLRALQRQLRRGEYHVFHFIGHGGYDQDADDGVLLFQDEVGRGRRVSGIQLGTILADEVSLRLAVLNSCEGARSSLQDPFSGVATSLIEREIPAVIGMQFEITDRAAIVFAGEFYSALADGLPVDSSVAEARKAIYADQNDIEWGTPVLFMRVADGRLFDVQTHPPVRPADALAAPAVTPPPIPDEPLVIAAAAAAINVADEERPSREAAEAADATERHRVDTESARIEAERTEAERTEAERTEAERIEAERIEAERIERERREAELQAERTEAERLEQERLRREAAEPVEPERVTAKPAERDQQAVEAADRDRSAVAAAAHGRDEAAVASAAGTVVAPPVSQPQSVAGRPLPDGGLAVGVGTPAGETARSSPSRATATGSTIATADSPSGEILSGRATADPSFSLARAIARAALGSFLGLAMIWAFVVIAIPSDVEGQSIEDLFDLFVREAGLTVLTVTVAVAFAEGGWRALRVPEGRAYSIVGGNPWLSAAIEGLIMGAAVAWLTSIALYGSFDSQDKQLTPQAFLLHAVFTSIGFVVADAGLHGFRGRARAI